MKWDGLEFAPTEEQRRYDLETLAILSLQISRLYEHHGLAYVFDRLRKARLQLLFSLGALDTPGAWHALASDLIRTSLNAPEGPGVWAATHLTADQIAYDHITMALMGIEFSALYESGGMQSAIQADPVFWMLGIKVSAEPDLIDANRRISFDLQEHLIRLATARMLDKAAKLG